MLITQIFLITLLMIASAFMYRWRGMNENSVPILFKPRIVRRLGCCVLIGLGLWTCIAPLSLSLAWIIPLVTVLSYYGIVVGHGSYFPRHDGSLNEDNENFAFITKLIADPLDQKARFVGMALTGLAVTVPPAAALAVFFPHLWLPLAVFAASGALKAVVYWVTPDTEWGEWVTGALFGAGSLLFLATQVLT